jgi:hypothetical protein
VGLGSTNAAQSSTPAPAAHPKRRGASVARLEVTALRSGTALQVHRGSVAGPLVFEGTLDKGKRMVFVGRRLWLDIARPEVLSTRLNGRVVQLPSVKTVVVTARGIRPASGA